VLKGDNKRRNRHKGKDPLAQPAEDANKNDPVDDLQNNARINAESTARLKERLRQKQKSSHSGWRGPGGDVNGARRQLGAYDDDIAPVRNRVCVCVCGNHH